MTSNKNMKLDDVWAKLLDGIERIYQLHEMSAPAWMELYTYEDFHLKTERISFLCRYLDMFIIIVRMLVLNLLHREQRQSLLEKQQHRIELVELMMEQILLEENCTIT